VALAAWGQVDGEIGSSHRRRTRGVRLHQRGRRDDPGHHDAGDHHGHGDPRPRLVAERDSVWGKIRTQEDYEDTQRVSAFDDRQLSG